MRRPIRLIQYRYGGIVALNREVDAVTAVQIGKIFIEAVIAPGFSNDALELLSKKQNIRLLVADMLQGNAKQSDIKPLQVECSYKNGIMQRKYALI